jgi:hypothetical protein
MKKLGLVLTTILALSLAVGATTVDFIAGQHYNAGLVEAIANDGVLTIYIMTDNGWALEETHVYVGTAAPKKSSPGRFPYKHEDLGNAYIDVYTISLDDFDVECGADLYIAVHAVVKGIDNEYGEETAWGEGDYIRAGKNWAMYFTQTVECEGPMIY